MCVLRVRCIYALFFMTALINADEFEKEAIDKVIEDEITHKLSDDLLQSIEKKFQVDLERSVDSVLTKIKLLLQNGTSHIQDKLVELQGALDVMRKDKADLVDECLLKKQNDTAALAEKALHQMVVCGYALIGHDPAQAMRNVMELKNMINTGLKPIYEQRREVYNLIKICGHDHDSLKKVIKCVISKSPQIKSAMMGISAKLVDGVVQLTKLMAHGAMHEACLIEVIRTVEDEAFGLVRRVKKCVEKGGVVDDDGETLDEEMKKYMAENNATVLDVGKFRSDDVQPADAAVPNGLALDAAPVSADGKEKDEVKLLSDVKSIPEISPGTEMPKNPTEQGKIKEEVREEMKKLLRRMMSETKGDDDLKLKLLTELEKDNNNNVDGKV